MPIFLPGPGPLEQQPHAPDAPAATPDSWTGVFQSRSTDAYRGSYSLNASAADQQYDQYSPGQIMDRVGPYYRPPPSRAINAFDNPAVAAPDTWASVVQSRVVPDYKPPLSQAINAVIQFYGPDYASFVTSRVGPYYRSPPSRAVAVFDQPTVTFGTDWASVAANRVAPFYRSPPSQIINAFTPPPTPDAWASVFQNRPGALYDPQRSIVAQAIIQFYGTDWASVIESRPAAWYKAPPSRLFNAFTPNPAAAGTDWTPTVQSRRSGFYRGSYSLFVGAADLAIAAPGAWTPGVIRSRPVEFYCAPLSAIFEGIDGFPSVILFSGGGGFGADMGARFTDRYGDRYIDQYGDRYVETFRIQRQK